MIAGVFNPLGLESLIVILVNFSVSGYMTDVGEEVGGSNNQTRPKLLSTVA